MQFRNTYEDETRAAAYAQLGFRNTYYLAYRDLPEIIRTHVAGNKALDFGCGTGRSTRFLRSLGFDAIGVDIAPQMVAKAREIDPDGDYRVGAVGDFADLVATRDLILCAFTFDNIPAQEKLSLLRTLRGILGPAGKVVLLVSTPEIYWHEWASFSTKDYPENRSARPGDVVRIVTTDFADRRPVEDVLCPHETYLELFAAAGLRVVATYRPLARSDEPYDWGKETEIAPWAIYVLDQA